jgi:four helix bundle protein
MSNYENLKVWHKAIDLAVYVYKLTDENKFFQKDFGLKDQMRRSSVSVPSNISEGDELGTDKQAIKQFYISKGSAAELYTQVQISYKIGYIHEKEMIFLSKECKSISSMLTNLIKSRYRSPVS